MTIIKFIGGPMDGQIRDVPESQLGGDTFRVPILPLKSRYDLPLFNDVRYAVYAKQKIADVEVWAIVPMRPPQIIELLVQRYGNK